MLLENALKLLIAKMPPDVMSNLANVAKSGIELKSQLDRIEQTQRDIMLLIASLVDQLQPKVHSHGRSDPTALPDPSRNLNGD